MYFFSLISCSSEIIKSAEDHLVRPQNCRQCKTIVFVFLFNAIRVGTAETSDSSVVACCLHGIAYGRPTGNTTQYTCTVIQ